MANQNHKPVKGRANTPEEKRAIVERLLAVWLQKPALRLGQLIMNTSTGDSPYAFQEVYCIEDEELVKLLEKP